MDALHGDEKDNGILHMLSMMLLLQKIAISLRREEKFKMDITIFHFVDV